MKTIAWEDRTNPGILYIPQNFSLTHTDRTNRMNTILKDLKHLGNCRIYRVNVKQTKRGKKVIKQRLVTSRTW